MTTVAHIEDRRVIVGIDTHADVHVAVGIDQHGRRLDDLSFPVNQDGYEALLEWASTLGELIGFGIEGTNCYGAGIYRHLARHDQWVIEVNRPNRQARRRHGKTDLADAEAAARAVLSGEAVARPKTGDATVEMIRVLRIERATAMRARTQAINALRALIITAPVELRDQLHGLSASKLLAGIAALELNDTRDVVSINTATFCRLAGRYTTLSVEIKILDRDLMDLTKLACPDLIEKFGVGPDTAGALLCAVGDNPDRLLSEPAFAMLCGVAPISASSGKTTRHRLNRGGNRQANAALYRIALVRM